MNGKTERFCIRRGSDYVSVRFDIRNGAYSIEALPRPFARLFNSREDAEQFRDLACNENDIIEIH